MVLLHKKMAYITARGLLKAVYRLRNHSAVQALRGGDSPQARTTNQSKRRQTIHIMA